MNILPIRFPDDLYEKLQSLSSLTGKPMAEIVRASLAHKVKGVAVRTNTSLNYTDPLWKMAKKVDRLVRTVKPLKYYYPKLSDDELLY